MKKGLVVLSLIVFSAGFFWGQEEVKPGIEGIWLGSFSAGGMELRLVFHISKNEDGTYSGTMDSPDQGAAGLEMNPVNFEEGILTAEWPRGQFVYTGKLAEDGLNIKGSFTQGGATFNLDLKKVARTPDTIRPQDPKKPYPYLEEEVEYRNERDGIKLAATLTMPKEGGPFPAVVLITGSGAQNRNEEVMGHRPFLVLADFLTRKGLAVLRADDRGVGGSEGDTGQSTAENFAYDALAGVAYLKSRPEIVAAKIGLAGHSEGGIIAPLAATLSEDVAFIVMMAGTGLVGEEIIYLQSALLSRAGGADEEVIEKSNEIQKKIFTLIKDGKDDAHLKEKLNELLLESFAYASKEEKESVSDMSTFANAQIQMLLSPWFRFFLTYDPAPTLRKIKCPVLALNGEKDLQVPYKENLDSIEEALKEGGNTDYTIKMLPGLNHLFQRAGTGHTSEYAKIPETINPAALNFISGWILERFK
jgi:fermentation-respiration switch protein FrsA (DUF1100 family)